MSATYVSPRAQKFAQLGSYWPLGFLGCLGFLGFAGFLPGFERWLGLFGLTGFFGFFGFSGFYGAAYRLESGEARRATCEGSSSCKCKSQ